MSVSNEVLPVITIDGLDAHNVQQGSGLELCFEFSINGGVTWTLMTNTDNGTVLGNNPTGPVNGLSQTFIWDKTSDLPAGDADDVMVRIRGFSSHIGAGPADVEEITTFDVRIEPSCVIRLPAGGTLGGDIPIFFTGSDPTAQQPFATIEYSVDGGGFFLSCDSGTGPLAGNPTPQFPSGVEQEWHWNSDLDIPGKAQNVILRVTVEDPDGHQVSCLSAPFTVDNTPKVQILGPTAGIHAGDKLVSFLPSTLSGQDLTTQIEWSIDGGSNYFAASNVPGGGLGSLSGNPIAAYTPAGTETWDWRTFSDIAGQENSVLLRITVIDAVSAEEGTDEVAILIDNRPSCQIFSPTSGAHAGDIFFEFRAVSTTGNQLTAVLEYDIGAGFVSATNVAGGGNGSLAGNPVPAFDSSLSESWEWDSLTDVGLASGLVFRLTVTDDGSAETSTCEVTLDTVNNVPPSCDLLLTGGSGTIVVTSNIDDLHRQQDVDYFVEWFNTASDNWELVSDAGGGDPPSGTITAGSLPFALSTNWDSPADIPGNDTVDVRVRVVDSLGLFSICQESKAIMNSDFNLDFNDDFGS